MKDEKWRTKDFLRMKDERWTDEKGNER